MTYKRPILKVRNQDLLSLKEAKAAFATLPTKLQGLHSFDDIKRVIVNSINGIPFFLGVEGIDHISMYRVTDGAFPEFDEEDINCFSYPPKQHCPQGRVNLKGFPVFYASLSGDNALREFRINNQSVSAGDLLYLSKWETRSEHRFRISSFLFGKDVKLGKLSKKLNLTMKRKLAEISKEYAPTKVAGFKLIMESLSRLFIIGDDYKVSSCIGHHTLYDMRNEDFLYADAIAYPSVRAGMDGVNFAVHPKSYHQKVKLVNILKVKFKEFAEKGSRTTVLGVGVPINDNHVKWYDIRIDFADLKPTDIEVGLDKKDLRLFNSTDKRLLFFYFEGRMRNLTDFVREILNNESNGEMISYASSDEEFSLTKRYTQELELNIQKDAAYFLFKERRMNVHAFRVKRTYVLSLVEKA